MKILYLIHGLYNSAGMERVLTNKVNYLSGKTDIDVFVLTTDQKNKPPFYPVSESIKLNDLGINFSDYYYNNIFIRVFKFFIKIKKFQKKLKTSIEQINPDIVVSLMTRSLPVLLKIRNKTGRFSIFYEHHFSKFNIEQMLDEKKRGFIFKLIYLVRKGRQERIIKKIDKLILLTEEDKEYWGGGFKNITVIPNAITFYGDVTSKLEEKTAISIGRLEPQKGFDILIEIWKEIAKENKEWKLKIYGKGKEKENLLKQIEKNDMTSQVEILPTTSEIQKVFLQSSIYIMTSRYEGMPMVLIESMSFGIPVIAFACKCGPKDIITDNADGFLIPQNDNKLMIEKIKLLINDYSLRKTMGQNAHRNIERYNEETIMNKWIALFNEYHI